MAWAGLHVGRSIEAATSPSTEFLLKMQAAKEAQSENQSYLKGRVANLARTNLRDRFHRRTF